MADEGIRLKRLLELLGLREYENSILRDEIQLLSKKLKELQEEAPPK